MMFQAGPLIRFVCEDHPDTPGCACVAEMVKGHRSARALVDQLKELNLSLQIELRESQRDHDRLRGALAGLSSEVAEWIELEFIMPDDDYLVSFFHSHRIDPKTLKGDEG